MPGARAVKLMAPSLAPAKAEMMMLRVVNMSECPFQEGQMGSVPCKGTGRGMAFSWRTVRFPRPGPGAGMRREC